MRKGKKILAILLTVLTIMGVFSSATTVIAADFSEAQARKAYFNENLSGYLKSIINTDNAVKITEVEEAQKIEATEEAEIVTANARTSTVQTYSSDATNNTTENETDIDHTKLTLELDDGSETAYMFSEPVSFIDDNGELVYKDINIQPLSNAELNSLGYSYENGANDYKTYFGANSANGIMLVNPNSNRVRIVPNSSITAEGQIVTLEDDGKQFDAFLYNGVYDSNTSLRYAPQLNGIKEEIIVASYTGKTTYEFTLYTENAVAAINSYGDIEIIDKNNRKIVDTFKAPFVYDSSEGFDQTSEHYADCEYGLEEVSEGQYNLTISVPAEYLSAETTQYPIIIDPTTSNISMTYDTSVYSAYSTNSHSSNITACFGRTSSSEYGRGRAMFYFKIPSDIEKYAKISSAKLYLRETTGRTDTMYVRPYIITDTWNNSVTWSTRPAYTTSISYPGKSGLALPRRNINSTSTDVSDSNYWYAFNITYAVRAWKSGTSNRGLMFIAECDANSDDYLWRAFATKEHTTSSYRPYAVISYTNDATVPKISSVSGNPTAYTNSNVTLKVTATDETYGIYRYSFDNGSTWQASNSKTFSSNQTVKIKVKDYAGNISATKSVSITKIDKTAPSATFSYGEVTDNYMPVDVTITLTDNCSLKSYSIDGDSTSISGTKKVITTEGEPGFEYTLVVTDTAGNKKTLTYSIDYPYPDDLSEPVAPDLFEENGTIYVSSRSFDFNEETDSEEYFLVDIGLYRYSFHDKDKMAVDVVHTEDITVEAWLDDLAGNMGDSSTITVQSKIGEYSNSYNDIAFGEGLLPIGFERTYSSKSGWFYNFNAGLSTYRNGFVFTDFYGDKHHFISDANGEYFSVDGDQLIVESGTIAGKTYSYSLEYNSLTLYFDSSKKLAAVADEYNTAIYTWSDTALTITNKIKSADSDIYTNAVVATVSLNNGKPVSITVAPVSSTETKTVSYSWNGNNLTAFTDASGTVHTYAYTDNLLTNDDGITIDYSNGRIKRITQKNGSFVKYTYNDNDASINGFYDNVGSVTITDSKGITDTFYYSDGIITSESGFSYTDDAIYNPEAINNQLTTDTISDDLHYFVEEEPDDESEESEEPIVEETEESSDLYDKYDDGSYTFYEYDESGRVITSLEVAAGALTVTDTTTFADAETVAESKTIITYADETSENVIEEIILERTSSGELVNSQKTTYSYNERGVLATYNTFSWLFETFWYPTYSEEYFYNDYGVTIKEITTIYTTTQNKETEMVETTSTSTTTEYVYDAWNQLVETVTDADTENEYNTILVYDALGRNTSVTSNDNVTLYEYNSDGNVTLYSENGEETVYVYDDGGDILSRTNPNGSVALYIYDSYGNLINHSFNGYAFTYNTLGSLLTAKSENQNLATYTYSSDTKQEVLSANFGNGQSVSYNYNTDGEIVSVKLGNDTKYAYEHFEQSDGDAIKEWTELTDYVNSIQKVIDENKTTVNDLDGNFVYSVENIVSESDEITGEAVAVGDTVYSINYGDVADIFTVGDTQLFTKSFEENDDGELLSETISNVLTTQYCYNSDSSIGTLENILNELTLEYSYGYNSKGNITAETLTRKAKGDLGETVDTVENVIYIYDSKQQLVCAENNTTKWEYSYDNRGNILTAKEYAVSAGTDGEKTYTLKTDGNNTFAYDTDWQDKLTTFNGQSITYDAIGNPVSYKGNTLTWTMGRQLASYDSNTYKYNEDGIRTSKTVNGVKTNYYLNGTDIIEQTDGTNTLHFYYDNTGEITGFTYNDNQYFYIKNAQDDIVAIADNSGNVISEYAYDPWGSVISVTGSNTEIGNLNPFRYRSYYYDSEINMYYLQSRYYDPEICRFINCDDVNYIGVNESEISYNPFAYCENDAVNNKDSSGYAISYKFVGFGVQIYANIANLACGIEIVWYNSRINTKKYKNPNVYFFVEGTYGRNGSTLKDMLNSFKKRPESVFKSGKILKNISFSICFFAIFADNSFKTPLNYEGVFTTVSATVKKVKGYVSTSKPKGCLSVGVGYSNKLWSVSASASYYWLISGAYGVFGNLRSQVKRKTNGIKAPN
ncbi:MAG: RHS repeat-associated core domain-containing protein [Clostridia bacterium]|nr:RHS repeat-associated core domain-containing protein [Clostridia bacterium]